MLCGIVARLELFLGVSQMKSNDISVDGLTLAMCVVKAVKDGHGLKWVSEQTGLKTSCISQRLKVIRENYPQLAQHMTFKKGVKGGKSVTKLDKEGLSALQALVAQLTGAPPKVVIENGVSLVQGEAITKEEKDMLDKEMGIDRTIAL